MKNNVLINRFKSKTSNYYTEGFDFLIDNFIIPSVYVERREKHIICISCMKGCPIGCLFCASGKNYFGLLNNEQINFMIDEILKYVNDDKKDILLSFMGSGEPVMNYLNVINTINNINDRINKFAISTSGYVINNINKFDFSGMKIQLSVHSVNDNKRLQMMKKTSKLDEIMNIIDNLQLCKVEYNFIFINKLNDDINVFYDIVKWCDLWDIDEIKVNKFHSQNGFIESYNKNQIINNIREYGINVEEYETDGVDINVSCGQMIVEQRDDYKIRGI